MTMNGSNKSLFEHDEFAECRKALDAAMRERSAAGMGTSVCKHTEIISEDEEQHLWEKGILGDENPQQLLDTVLYLTGLHFALRGGKEHRSLRLHNNPQITGPHEDAGSQRYICYTEDVSKTNHGGMNQTKLKSKTVRAYENQDSTRCYVRLYQKYKSLCPPSKKDAFYFTPRKRPKDDSVWYLDVPMGHNTLQNTVKRICSLGSIEGRKTNHSLRATAATRLFQANVEEQLICEQTGHRSNAVRTYKRSNDAQKALLSDIVVKNPRIHPEPQNSTTTTKTEKLTVSESATKPTAESTTGLDDNLERGNISVTFNFH